MKLPSPSIVLAAAKEYLQHGWYPVDMAPRSKAPREKGWQNLRLTTEDLPKRFGVVPRNIGLLLGEPSGGLVDVDLDCDEAILLAPDFLPPTPMVHGRKSKPKSHWWYRASPAPATEKFTDGPKACLIELRSTGGQTVVPPSVHEKGEQIDWEGGLTPAEVDPNTLRKQVATLAAASLLVRHWPKKGVRQDAALALAGGLLADRFEPERAEHFIGAVARAAKDKEWRKRVAAVRQTVRKLKSNKKITGWPRLAELIAQKTVERVRQFLGLDRAATALGPQSIADAIDAVLSAPKIPARIKRREAAELVIADLAKRGALIHAPGNRQFWFDSEKVRLHDIDAFPFRAHLNEAFRLNPAEPEFRHIMEAIKAATRNSGKKANTYRFSHYDRGKNLLYISAGQGRVVLLDGKQASWVANGADGILFEETEEPQVIPIAATTQEVVGNPVDEALLERVNFARGSGAILSAEQQRLILKVWIVAAFFPELLPARVLLLLYGEKGSGKSSTLRAILKILLGPNANVTPLGKEDGFNAAVSQEFLLALDNVDSRCAWIEDKLATVATGQTIRFRKLYTTNEMVSYPTRCCVALTARTPRFRRDDVVDRLLILRVDRLHRFESEAKWYAEIEARRVELWACLLRDLNQVVARLAQAPPAVPASVRMADWVLVACTIGEAIGTGDRVRLALEAAEVDKAAFLLETDVLYDLLHELATSEPNRTWKAGELFAALNARAQSMDMEFLVKSPKSLGRALHRLEPALNLMIQFEIHKDAHDGQATYTLAPLPVQKKLPLQGSPQGGVTTFRDPDF